MSLLDAVFGYAPAQIVHVAARLGIADLLADGAKGSDELAEATGTHEPSLRRLLRGLVCLGGVAEIRSGAFELTETGRPLRSDVPDSIRRLVMLSVSDEVWRSWGELEYSVRTGEPAWDKVTGMSSFAYFDAHPAERATFNAAMSEHTRSVAAAFIAGYDFSRFGTLVDLGGGNGTLVAEILRAISGLRCLIYDRSSGLEGAPAILAAAGVADRCELVEGDFFESVPAGADAYVLKSVIHDWDDEQTVAIFRNCVAAMAAESVLLVIEPVLPERITSPEDAANIMSDLNMLVLTDGRERTEAEFRALFEAAGLEPARLIGPLASYRIIEGVLPRR